MSEDDKSAAWVLETGEVLEVTNESGFPWAMHVASGDYGSIEFTVPLGGKFRLRAGTVSPTITFNDAEPGLVDGVNIVRIKDHR